MVTRIPRVIFLTGGIGNQLFQFTYGRWLQTNFGVVVKFANLQSSQVHGSSSLFLEENETIRLPKRLAEVLFKLGHRTALFIQKDLLAHPESTFASRAVPIQAGYWQTPFFLDAWNSPSNLKAQQIRKAMGLSVRSSRIDEVVVHVRRGDYRSRADKFGLLAPAYYRNCLEELNVDFSDPVAVLSDEPTFAVDMIQGLGWRHAFCPPENSLHPSEVLDYASLASKLVLSNSTFAWWAATIGSSEKLVAAPRTWFKSMAVSPYLLRDDWIKVESEWSER